MVEQNQNRKRIFYMIVLILTFIAMVISATIAYFNLIDSQREDETVLYSGTLQIDYTDGVYIKDPILYPMKEVDYNTYQDVYRNSFSIKSSGTLDQIIWIDLEVTKNEFTANALKYAVFNANGIKMDDGYVPKAGIINLASNLYLASGANAKYTIIIWLDDTNYNQTYESGHTITGKITAYARQVRQ